MLRLSSFFLLALLFQLVLGQECIQQNEWSLSNFSVSLRNAPISHGVIPGATYPQIGFGLLNRSTSNWSHIIDAPDFYTCTMSSIFEAIRVGNGSAATYNEVAGSRLSEFGSICLNGLDDDTLIGSTFTMPPVPNRFSEFNVYTALQDVNESMPNSYAVANFNLSLKRYQWVDTTGEAVLIVTFNLGMMKNKSNVDIPIQKYQKRTIQYNKAYIAINESAQCGVGLSDNTPVSIMMASEANGLAVQDTADIYLVYEHFDGDLFHDPEIGIGSGPSSATWIIIIVASIIVAVVLVLIVVVGTTVVQTTRKKKRQMYSEYRTFEH